MSNKAQAFNVLLAGIDFGAVPASGYVVYFVTAGTGPSIASLKTIWLDINKAQTASNPYTLDADGRAELYLDGIYDIIVKTAVGGTIVAAWESVNTQVDVLSGLNVDRRDASSGDVAVSIVAANNANATVLCIGKILTDVSANAVTITPASGTIGGLASWSITNSGEYALLIPIAADNDYLVK